MTGAGYKRTYDQLRQRALNFWPKELTEPAVAHSGIPKLLETQDQFIAMLGVPVDGIEGLFSIVSASSLPANLFLKHLVVLVDFAGEPLQRVGDHFSLLFPSGQLRYLWNGQEYSYSFMQLANQAKLSNSKLGITGETVLKNRPLSELQKDVITLLTFGSASTDGYGDVRRIL